MAGQRAGYSESGRKMGGAAGGRILHRRTGAETGLWMKFGISPVLQTQSMRALSTLLSGGSTRRHGASEFQLIAIRSPNNTSSSSTSALPNETRYTVRFLSLSRFLLLEILNN